MQNYPHKQGRYPDQAHVRVPEGTFELEHARDGFFSEEVSHLYVTEPPSNWKRIEGELKPRAVDCRPMITADSQDARALPTQLLSAAVWCGIVLPRGCLYRVIPENHHTFMIICESISPYKIPDRGLLGPHAIFDKGVLRLPDFHAPREKWDLDEYQVWTNNHVVPTANTTFQSDDVLVTTFAPRALGDEETLRLPFYHRNIDYDEFIFYHEGNFFSKAGIEPGMFTLHPAGIDHGPHPKAFERDRLNMEQLKAQGQEFAIGKSTAINFDTTHMLFSSQETAEAEWPGYQTSWYDQAQEMEADGKPFRA